MTTSDARPTAVTVIAWVWIVLGGLSILIAVPSLLLFWFVFDLPELQESIPVEVPWIVKIMAKGAQWLDLLYLLQLALGTFAVVSAIHFLRLRRWARTALEILSWGTLVYIMGFGTVWVLGWISMAGHIPAEVQVIDGETFQIIGAIMGPIMALIFALPFGIMVWHLRGDKVRNAVTQIKE